MYNENIKKATYKWRSNHLEHYHEICREGAKKFYENNKEKKLAYNQQRYYYKLSISYENETKQLRKILINLH